MAIDDKDTTDRARRDLAQRLGLREADVATEAVEPADFPGHKLGGAANDA